MSTWYHLVLKAFSFPLRLTLVTQQLFTTVPPECLSFYLAQNFFQPMKILSWYANKVTFSIIGGSDVFVIVKDY